MSRYRPPQPKSSPYITPEGADRLREELRQLWKIERPQVTAQVHEAAKNGDRSENGDYIYGKRRLREIDYRVRYLHKRLEEIIIVDQTPDDKNKVFFGAQVTLQEITKEISNLNDEDNEATYRLVGADEIDTSKSHISIDSPMARALIGQTVKSRINITVGNEKRYYRLVSICY